MVSYAKEKKKLCRVNHLIIWFSFSWIWVLALFSYWHALFSPHTLYCTVCMHICIALTILCISHLLAHHDWLIIQCLHAICYTTFSHYFLKYEKLWKQSQNLFFIWTCLDVWHVKRVSVAHYRNPSTLEFILLTLHLNAAYVSSVKLV